MRALVLLACLAGPAFAQDVVSYDDALLAACLSDVSKQEDDGAKGDPRLTCIGQSAAACMQDASGGTTVGMVQCLAKETAQWDKLLNDNYAKAMARFEAADAELKELGSAASPAAPVLKEAQRSWISYRDKSCEFEAVRYQGGTAGGPAAGTCALDLTAAQALRLMDIAGDGVGE